MDKKIPVSAGMRRYIVSKEYRLGGFAYRFKFPNGYGASVINHSGSYGLELGVLGLDGHLNYDTPVTSDVLGHLNRGTLDQALRDIMDLEPIE